MAAAPHPTRFGAKTETSSIRKYQASTHSAHEISFVRWHHAQPTDIGISQSVVLNLNIGYSILDSFFQAFLPDDASALNRDFPESRLRKREHSGIITDLKRGKHLLEYIAAPERKNRVLTYTGKLASTIPDIIKAEFDRLSQTIFNIDGSPARLKYEEIAISHDQSTDARARHFNFLVKFHLQRKASSGVFIDEKTRFHDQAHFRREVVLNIHFQTCPSPAKGKAPVVKNSDNFLDALYSGLQCLNGYITGNIVALDDLSVAKLTTGGYTSTRAPSTTPVPAAATGLLAPQPAHAHTFLAVPPPPPILTSHSHG